MSYIRFQQVCEDCGKTWNAAFGMAGTLQLACPPSQCPYCGSKRISHYADGWKPNDGREE